MRIRGILFLALVAAIPLTARSQTSGGALAAVAPPVGRVLLDTAIGASDSYSTIPSIQWGATIERPLGDRFDLRGGGFFSGDHKTPAVGGRSLVLEGAAIAWITPRIGALVKVERSYLWTSQYSKRAWYPDPGVVVRDSWFGSPGRLEITYTVPTGCQWGPSCPIQGARLQGVTIYQEFRIAAHLRLGVRWGVFHGLEQGNNLEPSAGRIGYVSGFGYAVIRYEFGAASGRY